MKEINSNPYLLPNVSLEISYFKGECNGYLSLFTTLNIMTKYYHTVPNYVCNPSDCEVVLTGPWWMSSAQVAAILHLNFIPQVT